MAGRTPPSNMNLDDWLHASPAADIYVLGYVMCLCCISVGKFIVTRVLVVDVYLNLLNQISGNSALKSKQHIRCGR